MTPENFALWLQGYVELNGTAPTLQQWEIIKDHLKEVFDKRTPNRDNGVQQPTQGPITSTPYPIPKLGPGRFPTTDFDWGKWKENNQTFPGLGPVIC